MAQKNKEADSAEKDIITTQKMILGVLVVVILALLVYISILGMSWTRLGCFFEDIWHWFKRTTDLNSRHYDEDLTNDDIHEIMNIIQNNSFYYEFLLPTMAYNNGYSVRQFENLGYHF